ncbi:tetratricopeptide repeat protein [Halpernia frigidisoli]|uniref:Tetratricopeptide repeat protein n=1 Tax=Halpernia frigidisoli TaxID=1125876 RepID=A0A1I3DRU8_9FLAO|nr:hypothetical protein [Halpernia frigidisoli]SFH89432.1 hypothetical protein SAMN05443292_0665 [Halpernia frigidisoli]
MKKLYYFLFFLISLSTLKSQNKTLKFDHNYIDSENHWITVKNDKTPGQIFFAYLYFDESGGGYSLRSLGSFNYDNEKISDIKKSDNEKSANIMRVPNAKIAFGWLDNFQVKDLGLPEVPLYMKVYNSIDDKNEKIVERASSMNGLGDSKNAVAQLQKVYDNKFKSKKLYFEMAYALNALGNFEMAKKIAEEALTNNFKDEFIDKEYLYALIHSNNLEIADQFLKKNISEIKSPINREESIVNILNFASKNKQTVIFNYWLKFYYGEFSNNGKYKDAVKKFESDINQK